MGKHISQGMLYGIVGSVCSISIYIILTTWDPFSQGISRNAPFITVYPLWLVIWFAIIEAPVIEEIIFRASPILLIRAFSQNKIILWFGIIAVSAFFGKLHGSWNNIFIQGSVGIIFSCCFMREGYIGSVSAHATSNSLILIFERIFEV